MSSYRIVARLMYSRILSAFMKEEVHGDNCSNVSHDAGDERSLVDGGWRMQVPVVGPLFSLSGAVPTESYKIEWPEQAILNHGSKNVARNR